MDNLARTRQILSKALFIPADDIQPEDRLLEMEGMDSLAFEMIALEIEDATGQDLDVAKAMNVETVADLVSLLDSMGPG